MVHDFRKRFLIRGQLLAAAFFLSVLVLTLPAAAAEGRPPRAIAPDQIPYGPLRFQPPQAERMMLENGMILYVLEDHELPLVNLSLVVRTGSMYDPDGKEGLAELTATVMRTGGTKKMTGRDVDDALEFVAASLEPSSAMEQTVWSLNVMRQDAEKAMGILTQILREPLFDSAKWQLAKDLKLEELRRLYDDPQKLAFREFNKYLYRGNARGRLASKASIQAITQADLLSFHRAYYFPRNVMIAISGDLSRIEALTMIHKNFGSWNERGEVKALPPPAQQQAAPIYYLVKDTPQSVVITGQLAPAKTDKAFYAFSTLDFLIGSGGFRSRIFQEVRTNRGLAYSAGSFYRARTDYGVFGTYAMTKTESVPEVLALIQSILQEARSTAPDPNELARAKKAALNSFIFEYQSAKQIAAQQMMLEYNGLPKDFLATYCPRIEKSTINDLQQVGADYLRPADMLTLVLGTEEGYELLQKTFEHIEKIRIQYD